MKHPDREECYRYLDEYKTPEKARRHCVAVAAVACRLGEALNENGGTKAAPLGEIVLEKHKRDDGSGRSFYVQGKDSIDRQFRTFDLEAVLAAGLLHDMARVDDDHWHVAADFCERRGYMDEAKIIRVHMQYEFTNDANHLTEVDLVCLGDRLTLEDRYVGLDRRMDYIIQKAIDNGHPEARPVILKKKEHTRKLLEDIERRIGSIDRLMESVVYD